MRFIEEAGLTFDDVTLVPRFSNIASRHDVDLSCGTHFGLKMTTPILSANMATVTGHEMCKAMKKAGGLGILHRFQTLGGFPRDRRNIKAVSIGVDKYESRLELYALSGARVLCVDVAHGHHKKVGELLDFVNKNYEDRFKIIAGNVCTAHGAAFLLNKGADIIKVGVGPGSHCTTRVVTGHGVPQLTAIMKVAKLRDNPAYGDFGIIADGGIRNSGDIAKSLAAGADYVMIGRILAGCEEAPSEAVLIPNGLVKVYRGSASYEAQSERRDKRTIISEGVQSHVHYTGSVEMTITKLSNGLKSACSYTGARNIEEFKSRATMMRVSGASYVEGTPHGA